MEGYVQGALRNELRIARFVEHFKTTTLESLTHKFCQNLNNLLKHCISNEFLLMEGYVQDALRKELHIARFKTTTLRKSYW